MKRRIIVCLAALLAVLSIGQVSAQTIAVKDGSLDTYLGRLARNNVSSPHSVRLTKVEDLSNTTNYKALFDIITRNAKYIVLDLTAYTGSTIRGPGLGYACSYVTGVVLPPTLTSLSAEAFSQFYNLTSLDIPPSVTSVGNGAFYGNSKLMEIDAPGVTTWGYQSLQHTPFNTYATGARINLASGITWNNYTASSALQSAYRTGGAGWYEYSGGKWVKDRSGADAGSQAAPATAPADTPMAPVEDSAPSYDMSFFFELFDMLNDLNSASSLGSGGSGAGSEAAPEPASAGDPIGAPYAAKIGATEYATLGAAITAAGATDVIEIYTVTGPALSSAINNGGLGKKYRLMQDIGAGTGSATDVATPIGGATPFTGTFDGNGHSIALNISSGAVATNRIYTYAGLFGYLDTNAVVKNLSLTGTVNVSADNALGGTPHVYVGALAGLSGAEVSAVRSSVAVTAVSRRDFLYVGGLAGRQDAGTISNCYSTGALQVPTTSTCGTMSVGGIVGYQSGYGSYVMDCYATGNVSANVSSSRSSDIYVGGITGWANGGITGCVALQSALSSSGGGNKRVGRVFGFKQGYYAAGGNYAWSGMGVSLTGGSNSASTTPGAGNPYGADFSNWGTAGWTFTGNPWKAGSYDASNTPKLWFE